MRQHLAPFLAVLVLSASPLGPKPQKTREVNPCDGIDNTMELNECWGAEYDKVDQELNRVYQELLSKEDSRNNFVLRRKPGLLIVTQNVDTTATGWVTARAGRHVKCIPTSS